MAARTFLGRELYRDMLGAEKIISIVAKTTSQQNGRGTVFGCQPTDRFHNFYLPPGSCYLQKSTWICLNEFYELDFKVMLRKRFEGKVNPVCTIDDHILAVQQCALFSSHISPAQATIIMACVK